MNEILAIILSVLLLAGLLAIFFVTFVLYKKTPAPKGCENLGIDKSKCAGCDEKTCRYNLYQDYQEGKKK